MNNHVTITPAGNVGIPTTNAGYKLNVVGDINSTTYVRAKGVALTSDIRLKKNITKISNVLEKLKAINGVRFEWIEDKTSLQKFPSGAHIGMIAQELEKEFPELVNTNAEGYKAIEYANFTAVLLEAIKEPQTEIDSLKKRIEMLEAKK